ncbi:hypothetical protein BGZ67_002492 [Mortierella alpina]|nr:hypothetical protein BGZ67_002492 [Mortierella alpina]
MPKINNQADADSLKLHESSPTSSGEELRTYNILLLGQTQSGKTTFLEGIRKYVDPLCEIDTKAIGNGHKSTTQDVYTKTVETDLAEYRLLDMGTQLLNPMQYVVFQSQNNTAGREIDSAELFGGEDHHYRRLMHRMDDLRVHQKETSNEKRCRLRIFDTPGLDDTNGHDVTNIAKIVEALSSSQSVHLVLIMIAATTPLTPELRNTLRTYANIFSEMKGLMAFVHTKCDYRFQHSSNQQHRDFARDRMLDLEVTMGRRIPSFFVDCNLQEYLPAPTYLRQRSIHSILELAKFNVAVPLRRMQLCKTQKMTEVDRTILNQYNAKMEEISKQSSQTDQAITAKESEITAARYAIRELEEKLSTINTDKLELVYEERFEESWDILLRREEMEFKSPTLDYAIDHADELMHAVDVKEQAGGKGCRFWRVRIKRNFCRDGLYHVKLYVKRCNLNRDDIIAKEKELSRRQKDLEELMKEQQKLEGGDQHAGGGTLAGRKQLKAELSRCMDMISRASRQTLHLKLFKALAQNRVYEGDFSECVTKAADFYSKYAHDTMPEASLQVNDGSIPTYNVLLLGQTQSGKSSFLEAIRKYVDEEHEIEEDLIGNGSKSHTKEVCTKVVETTFPKYQLHYSDGQEVRDDYIFVKDFKTYKQRINQTENLEVRRVHSCGIEKSRIRVFDTPGLDDSNGHDERNVAKILTALKDSGDIHLVLIMISRWGTLTHGQRGVLRLYSEIFSQMKGLMAFVHTKCKFETQHFEDKKLPPYIESIKVDLNDIMGRDIQHFFIECDFEDDKPSILFLRNRIIRHILLKAIFNLPVPTERMRLEKTPRMKDVDSMILKVYDDKLQRNKEMRDKAIGELDDKITDALYEIRELEQFLHDFDTNDLELIDEKKHDQEWSILSWRHKAVLEVRDLEFAIDVIRVDKDEHTTVTETLGGEGQKFWRVSLTSDFFQQGRYHAKLYVKRGNKYRPEINERRTALAMWKETLEARQKRRAELAGPSSGDSVDLARRQELQRERGVWLNLINRAKRSTLHFSLFKMIAEAGVYDKGSTSECMEKAAAFYKSYVPSEVEEVMLERDEMQQHEP